MKSIASKVFNSVAKVYDSFLEKTTLGYIHKWQNELISKTSIDNTILDIGTGTGEILKKITKSYKNINCIGIDISLEMLKIAKSKVPNASFILADIHNLPLKEKSTTNIFSSLTLRHLDYEKLLPVIKKILKENGEFSILDIQKPPRIFYVLVMFFMKFLFRPIGRIIFSKEEYEYFIHSVENSFSKDQLIKLFEENGFKNVYISKKLFGIVILAVFKKEN